MLKQVDKMIVRLFAVDVKRLLLGIGEVHTLHEIQQDFLRALAMQSR
ncbi:hypothetical protein J2X83_001961 [Brevibacillus nitrificans]|nr:hypothetical protein [Brevibacillus nitrificans]